MSEDDAPQAHISVRVLEERGKSVLVEWDDGRLHRAYVPRKALAGESVAEDVLDEAPRAGIAWEQLLDFSKVTAAAIAEQLRRAGIWTMSDLKERDRVLHRIAVDTIGNEVWRVAKVSGANEGDAR